MSRRLRMATSYQDYDVITLIKDSLKNNIKDVVYNTIVAELTNDFVDKAEPIIRKEVDKVVLDSVESIRDALRFREEIIVNVNWKSEDTCSKT